MSILKFLINVGALVALLLFLGLVFAEGLHWYSLSSVPYLRRSLFAWMTLLSFGNCLVLLRNLLSLRHRWERLVLKLAGVSPATETAAEYVVRYIALSVTLALCFYGAAGIWGVVSLVQGPAMRLGQGALLIFVVYDVWSVVAGVKALRIKRAVERRQAKKSPAA